MSYQPKSGGQPPSFKTNVNRAKTKRWVEAKSYTYDGDDWGDADEYDEYGGYDEPPPPTKPTGLRQQGQSAHSIPQNPYASPPGLSQSPSGNGRSGYGNLSGPQQPGLRSATNPQPRVDTELTRTNSFDRGDEKRAFSAGGPQQGTVSSSDAPHQQQSYPHEQAYEAPNVQSPMQFDPNQMRPVQPNPRGRSERPYADQAARGADPVYAPPANYREHSYSQDSQHRSIGSRTQSMTSNTSSLDIHNRRDFTPSALPQPLNTRSSPSPDSRHPPRKSSLSQMTQPQMTSPNWTSNVPVSSEVEPTHRERTSSNAEKPLPFVRPADIYRRMQEEKERERQSQESSRPSMDAITGSAAQSERANHPVLREEEPNPSDPATNPTPSAVLDSIEAREQDRPRTLDSVAERRSEYALDESIGDHHTSTNLAHDSPSASADSIEGATQVSPRNVVHNTLSPVLPEVARMSAFGDSFLNTRDVPEQASSQANLTPSAGDSSLTDHSRTSDESTSNLQHQPSSGFRSVVHQAFDRTDDQIPPTPTSTAGSSVQRSESRGTSVISPIISRGPSTTTPRGTSDMRPMTPTQEMEDASPRPMSSDSAGTTKQVAQKQSPMRGMSPEIGGQSPPANFIPGHRRDLSTPSPGNSPARTPALEINNQLRRPQEAEVAIPTPTEPAFGWTTLSQEKAPRDNDNASPVYPQADSSRKRSQSPNKSRVRDLAGKFEIANNSRRGSDQSLSQQGGSGRTSPQRVDLPISTRPLADRMESFRPHLPGSWDSYISNAPSTASVNTITTKDTSAAIQRTDTSEDDTLAPKEADDTVDAGTPTTSKQKKTTPSKDDTTLDDLSSTMTADSSAPAGAFAADTGSGHNSEPAATPKGLHQDRQSQHESNADYLSSEYNSSINSRGQAHISQPEDDELLQNPAKPQEPERPSNLFQPPMASEAYGERSEQNTPLALPFARLSLRTDTGSTYESDRLRREIERSLTPNMPSEPTTAESDSPYQGDQRIPDNVSIDRHGVAHESMVIPREYDSYWNGSESVHSSRPSSEWNETSIPLQTVQRRGEDEAPAPPAKDESPRAIVKEQQSPLADTRPAKPQHRFSWERTSLSEVRPLDPGQGNTAPAAEAKQPPNVKDSPLPDPHPDHEVSSKGYSEPPAYEGSVEFSEPLAEKQHTPDLIDDSGFKGTSRAAEQPQQDHSLQQYEQAPVTAQSDVPPNIKVEAGFSPPRPHPSAQPKIPAFREILALKTPAERIRGFNEAREQSAKQDIGLAHWLAVTTAELPEHADALASVGRRPAVMMGHKPSSSRLLSGFRSTGPQSDASEASNSAFGQGSVPSGGSNKLSSQQVQAKGKDLLHTAGVFGGKANVAAKGLFSKGRSKLRGAGGSDKVDK